MKTKNGDLRISIRYSRWYDRLLDKFRSNNTPIPPFVCKAGELRFTIYFDKNGKIIEQSAIISFNDGSISFINSEVDEI